MEKASELPVVVAAVVVRKFSVMMAQRRAGSLAGFWEFPGGKVETGETHAAALVREIREELGVECEVGVPFGESQHVTPNGTIRLFFYRCELAAEPVAGDSHHAVAWLGPEDFAKYRIAPADFPIIERLLGEWNPTTKE